jgi:putative nucleotidyltransferase with HDIG domain
MATICIGNLRERINSIPEIATLPDVMARILVLIEDNSSTAVELAREVARDPALTLKILRSVNSAYYGFQRQILTVHDAVVLLGFSEIERLALAIMVVNAFGKDRTGVKALHTLWRHSLACSLVAGMLEWQHFGAAAQVRGAHVAGLLHDIGKAVIVQYFPEYIEPIMHVAETETIPISHAELEVLGGVNHCDIGSWLAERWRIPEALVESIALHHSPDTAPPHHLMVHVTHLADGICNSLGIVSNPRNLTSDISPRSCEVLGFDNSTLACISDHLEKNRRFIDAIAVGAMF